MCNLDLSVEIRELTKEHLIRDLDYIERAVRDKYDRIALKLADFLIDTWSAETKTAINEAIRTITDKNTEITADELALILKRIGKRLGVNFASIVENSLGETVTSAYRVGQEEILKGVAPTGNLFTFNLVDEQAIDWARENITYWIGEHYGSALSKDIGTIAAQVISEGLSREAAGNLFKTEFGERFKRSKNYWEGLSNHTVTRAREFGRTEAYVKAQVQYVKIVAVVDHRTSDICRLLNGRVFPTSYMVKTRDKLMSAKSPEAAKKVTPWVKPETIEGKPTDKLRQSLSMPPFHFNCRTRTVIATEEQAENQYDHRSTKNFKS